MSDKPVTTDEAKLRDLLCRFVCWHRNGHQKFLESTVELDALMTEAERILGHNVKPQAHRQPDHETYDLVRVPLSRVDQIEELKTNGWNVITRGLGEAIMVRKQGANDEAEF